MLLLLLSTTACTNSGLGQTTPSGSTADTAPPVDDCPWIGTWELSAVGCSTFAFNDFYFDHDGARLTITQNDQIGGCDVALDILGPACVETESMHFGTQIGLELPVVSNGISACDPAGCTFGTADLPCEQGDRSLPTQTYVIDDSSGDLVMVDVTRFDISTVDCPLEINTTWQLVP